jgi:hypothetical protein
MSFRNNLCRGKRSSSASDACEEPCCFLVGYVLLGRYIHSIPSRGYLVFSIGVRSRTALLEHCALWQEPGQAPQSLKPDSCDADTKTGGESDLNAWGDSESETDAAHDSMHDSSMQDALAEALGMGLLDEAAGAGEVSSEVVVRARSKARGAVPQAIGGTSLICQKCGATPEDLPLFVIEV